MLTSKEQKRVAEEISNSSNVIGKGTALEGNIETYGNIRIEGRVIGSIKSKSKIALRHSNYVDGNIIAQNADTLYPLASTYKPAVLWAVLKGVDDKNIQLCIVTIEL